MAVDDQTESSSALEEATSSAADVPEPSAGAVPAPEGAQQPRIVDPCVQEFVDVFGALSAELKALGYYQDRPEYTVSNTSRSDVGVEKRALITMARERLDIVYSLSAEKLKDLTTHQLPYVDRKTKNAMERMAGTFAGGEVDESFGGEATTQDLVRLVIAAHIACDRDVRKSNDIVSDGDAQALAPGYLKSISALLPDIVEVLKAEPDPTSLERADAAEAAKVAKHEAITPLQRMSNREPRERRSRDGGQDTKPGDWLCPACMQINFARRTDCFKCNEPRPESAGSVGGRGGRRDSFGGGDSTENRTKPGDWPCPACGANNFARRTECFRCDEPRPAHIPMPQSFGGGAPEPREGDWGCPECGVNNFSYRGECFRCQAPRPGGAPPPRQQRRSFGESRGDFESRPAPEMRPGDWMCPDCSAHNFASKVVCYRCSSPRPESAGPPIERRSRDYGGRGDYSRGRGSSEGWTSGNDRRGQSFGGGSTEPADLEW